MHRLLGLSVAAAILLAGCADSSAQPAGRAPGEADVATTAAPAAPPSIPPGSPAEAPAGLPEIEVRQASLPAPVETAPPVRLVYGAIGADMPVDPVGVADDGQMEIPEDALRAGWYRFAAAPSDEAGAVVVAAHAGSFITPRGPLYDLSSAEVGHRVTLVDSQGGEVTYEVTAVERLGKATLDFRPYFDREGGRRLILITCGGNWDEERQSYDDNIIVTATVAP